MMGLFILLSVIFVIYFIIIFLGIWLLPYLNIKTCESFFEMLPVTGVIILTFSMAFYENKIRELTKIKEIYAHFEKKEKEERRKQIIRKRMEREILERENNMLRRDI